MQARGFSYEVQEETGEDVLVFDTWHRGPEVRTSVKRDLV